MLEFCPHGDLNAFLKEDAGTWENLRYNLALGVAKCLSYLHHELKEPLIHRDIKPDNVLVGEGIVAKVADFGESRHFDTKKASKQSEEDKHIVLFDGESANDALSMTMVGTQLYCAPEIMMRERYNESVVSSTSFVHILSAS